MTRLNEIKERREREDLIGFLAFFDVVGKIRRSK